MRVIEQAAKAMLLSLHPHSNWDQIPEPDRQRFIAAVDAALQVVRIERGRAEIAAGEFVTDIGMGFDDVEPHIEVSPGTHAFETGTHLVKMVLPAEHVQEYALRCDHGGDDVEPPDGVATCDEPCSVQCANDDHVGCVFLGCDCPCHTTPIYR